MFCFKLLFNFLNSSVRGNVQFLTNIASLRSSEKHYMGRSKIFVSFWAAFSCLAFCVCQN